LLAKHQTRVVVYRQATEKNPGAVSVYINGDYQASLQRGAFTELCVPPLKVEVSARMTENGQVVRNDYDVTNSLTLEGGKEVFVRVFEDTNGRALMMQMRPEQALPELVKTRAQIHTISRVSQAMPCQDLPKPTAVKASTKVGRSITLGADALFPFGKSDVELIPPKGRRILDHLIDRIKSEFGSGKTVTIHITGHADSFGSDAGNLKLSKQRAAAIKTYFVHGGLLADSISADGRGDKDLVVTNCGKALTAANVACNKPNRRVVIEVTQKQVAPANN
jgi:OOP family OmpA-OmpF porin